MRKDPGISRADSHDASPELFDGQARFFDRRTGLPEDCCRAVAEKILEVGEVRAGDLVVEVGCGTGQIGQWVAAQARYVGFDLSAGMLGEFRRRLGAGRGRLPLVRADANATWPFAAGAAGVIFSSRAMHLLEQGHVAAEVFRLASPAGATLVVGRVERTPGSVKELMAQEMNERLRRRGLKGRRGERRNRKLFDACARLGAEILEPVPVATWGASASPRQSLDSWRRLAGLGGVPVSAETRAEVVGELEVWAAEVFGGLDRAFEFEETYVLSPLRVPPARKP
ncbi:MAG TPA: class I SAM-dependent methyltransferase [Pyrinomonadaceae bacterium]|nr:class I SAM-dependent methyltransferase [Pyrinomonadaceae bacterium]